MKIFAKTFTTLLLTLVLVTSLVVPASAVTGVHTAVDPHATVEPRANVCPYCIVALDLFDERLEERVKNKTCSNTASTGYVHPHYYYYTVRYWMCPSCGYTTSTSTFLREKCSVTMANKAIHLK